MTKTTNNIKIRKASERGHANHGWLDTYHTFSFADYYDSNHMGFRTLRVINDDTIAPDNGFGTHSHNNMEIISYVSEGNLQHKDSMGNGSVIKKGGFQRITAGTGITHSEFNPSKDQKTHLLQIWILPEAKELTPSYQELTVTDYSDKNGLTLIASHNGKDKVLKIHQDVFLYKGKLKATDALNYTIQKERGVWIQITKGEVEINGNKLKAGDGASVENENEIKFKAIKEVEFLLFDLK